MSELKTIQWGKLNKAVLDCAVDEEVILDLGDGCEVQTTGYVICHLVLQSVVKRVRVGTFLRAIKTVIYPDLTWVVVGKDVECLSSDDGFFRWIEAVYSDTNISVRRLHNDAIRYASRSGKSVRVELKKDDEVIDEGYLPDPTRLKNALTNGTVPTNTVFTVEEFKEFVTTEGGVERYKVRIEEADMDINFPTGYRGMMDNKSLIKHSLSYLLQQGFVAGKEVIIQQPEAVDDCTALGDDVFDAVILLLKTFSDKAVNLQIQDRKLTMVIDTFILNIELDCFQVSRTYDVLAVELELLDQGQLKALESLSFTYMAGGVSIDRVPLKTTVIPAKALQALKDCIDDQSKDIDDIKLLIPDVNQALPVWMGVGVTYTGLNVYFVANGRKRRVAKVPIDRMGDELDQWTDEATLRTRMFDWLSRDTDNVELIVSNSITLNDSHDDLLSIVLAPNYSGKVRISLSERASIRTDWLCVTLTSELVNGPVEDVNEFFSEMRAELRRQFENGTLSKGRFFSKPDTDSHADLVEVPSDYVVSTYLKERSESEVTMEDTSVATPVKDNDILTDFIDWIGENEWTLGREIRMELGHSNHIESTYTLVISEWEISELPDLMKYSAEQLAMTLHWMSAQNLIIELDDQPYQLMEGRDYETLTISIEDLLELIESVLEDFRGFSDVLLSN